MVGFPREPTAPKCFGCSSATCTNRLVGTARLDEAVAAYRAASVIFEAEGVAHYIEMAAGNLEAAETLPAERAAPASNSR